MTKTFQTADMCELADKITKRLCFDMGIDLNYHYVVDEQGDETDETDEEVYSDKAQVIFDICFNAIEEEYEVMGFTNERDL